MTIRFRGLSMLVGLVGLSASAAAQAQDDGILIEPELPYYDYDGSTLGVLDKPRPDYDALGIPVRGFLVYPAIDLGIGYNSNIFLTENGETGDFYGIVAPSLRARSNWSRHELAANANGTFRRYFDNSVRNEDSWNAGIRGRLDIRSDSSVSADLQTGRQFETPFTGEVDSEVASLSSYRYDLVSLRGSHVAGRNRFAAALNHSNYEFSDVEFADGSEIDQSNRDRTINGVVLQAEHAFRPSLALYGQLSYAQTDYDDSLALGVANRDSDGYRAIGGVSFDAEALVRGIAAVGYTRRDYDSPLFSDVGGFSFDTRLEYFYSRLTTFTFRARRIIQDSSLGITSAYFDNRVSLFADHELRQNVILSGSAELSHQDFIDSPLKNTVYRLGARGRYLFNRSFSSSLGVTYSERDRNDTTLDDTLHEFRIELRLIVAR